jgi:DNA-binding LytR/AlgR family response regulator
MGKIRILAVEDEPIHQETLYMILEELNYELVGMADTIKEAMHLLFSTKPDLILLDIALEEENDGIELAKKINQTIPTPIIFTTSFSDKEIMQKAISTSPYAYLVKPIREKNLQAAIELALIRFGKEKQELEHNSFQNWNDDLLVKDSFFTKQAGKIVKVKFEDVCWIEVLKDKYCKIKTINNDFTIRTSLKDLAKKISQPQFIRTHRAYIVNAQFLESMDDADGTVCVFGHTLPMGRIYKEQVFKRLNLI